jgi:hypothetical protein
MSVRQNVDNTVNSKCQTNRGHLRTYVSLATSKREDQIQFVGLRVSIVRKFDESVGKRSKRTHGEIVQNINKF